MSDELDDGETPKGSANDRIGPSGRGERERNDVHGASTHAPRSRDRYPEPRTRSYARSSRSRSRTGYRSPLREDVYARQRPRSPRGYERAPAQDSLPASSRSRPPAARKEPSVRDANTRADLGRLAREAEAAAYKARTAALNKNPVISTKTSETASAVAPARLDKPTRAEANSANIRADSRSPMVATGRDESRRPSDNSTARRIVEARSPVREKRPRSLTRRSSPDSNRSAPAIRRGLTAADIGRLEREKEAAAYKAKVLAEQKLQSKHTDSTSQIKPSNTHDRKTAPTSNAEARTSTPVVAKKQESPAVSAEVVIHVKSICPQLDSQLASLKAEYELLLKQDHKKQADLRVSMRQWAMLERESQREAHKSELAQLSLEATSAM